MSLSEQQPPEDGPPDFPGDGPLHGFQGDRAAPAPAARVPAGVTVALSREAGSRGSTIAKRAGQKLGWQVFDQEMLEHSAQEETIRHETLGNLSPEQSAWVDRQMNVILEEASLNQRPGVLDLARMVLELGAKGEVLLVGRGAGHLLPAASTLHVRIVAPLSDRVRYMSQWLRLPADKAAEQVRDRDSQRDEFLAECFPHRPKDPYTYDLTLNSSSLGEETCAELIATAARAKAARLEAAGE
jgi:cytidylate kinase